jgi:zinc transport system ATP-binding protein
MNDASSARPPQIAASSGTPPAIEVRDLSFSYDGDPVLEDVNLTVPAGDFVSIVGPNGGGKTTLLRLLLGLLQPSRGSLRVLGMAPERARSRVGYMPQGLVVDPRFPASAMDVVLMGRLGHGRQLGPYRRADRDIAARALAEVGLSDLRKRAFSALSGGQRQRFLIARALAAEPDLLLMDEPAASLDRLVEHDFYELLKALNERLTIVVVSHDFGFVSHYVKTVVCVKRTVAVHPTGDVPPELVSQFYGLDVRLVRHDVRCTTERKG